jgi:ectoine hydroxylase-related dioxygenase (phytanoyl-CoA dioxygenase family)
MDLRKETEKVLPNFADGVDQALRDIGEYGVAILPDTLSPSHLAELREAVAREAEADRRTGLAEEPYFADAMLGKPSQRVWNLVSRGQIFCDLVEHPVVMELVDAIVEGPPRLSTFSANITQPGSGTMHLHADQGTNPEPWGERPQGLNIIWCLEDFTDENGATRMVPGSHRLNRSARPDELDSETVAVEAPAGSLIAMESRVWHKTGANVTRDRTRMAILAFYGMDCFQTNENWYLCLSSVVRESDQDSLLRLLGFGRESALGRVYGRIAR